MSKGVAPDVAALVEAYGKLMGAGKMGAPQTVVTRFRNAYTRKLEQLAGKYPDQDFRSPRFQSQLEERARNWLSSQAMFGPGRDW